MEARPNVCVVGSSNIDLISKVPRLPRMGETLVGHSFHIGYGGKGANQAVMAAKLGGRVSMVTKVGRDVFGEGTIKNYRDQGIDTTYVLVDDSRTSGVAPIFVDDNAQNFIVIIPGANARLAPQDVHAARDSILAADLVICQLEIPIETTLETFRIAKSADLGKSIGRRACTTILNPAPAASLPHELLELTDICAPNETEAEILTGESIKTIADAERAARKLQERGPRTVILTLGKRGVLLVDPIKVEHIPPVQINAVDPTGAGDAFVGSLAVFLGERMSLRDAVRRSNAVAALSVTRIGTQVSFPTRDETDVFLREQGLT